MRLDLTLDQLENTVFCAKYRNFKRKLVRKMTKMTSSEIDCALMLHYKFVLAHKERRNQYMTPSQLADFYQIYFHMPNFNFVQEVIKYVDPSSKGAISAEGFVRLIEIWIYGNFADRMKFCFAVYDYPESGGFLTRYKVEVLCRNMVLAELAEDQYDLLASYVDFVFRKMDVDRDGLISYDDYAHVVTENPKLLQIFGPVIPDLEEMGAILGQAKADPLP